MKTIANRVEKQCMLQLAYKRLHQDIIVMLLSQWPLASQLLLFYSKNYHGQLASIQCAKYSSQSANSPCTSFLESNLCDLRSSFCSSCHVTQPIAYNHWMNSKCNGIKPRWLTWKTAAEWSPASRARWTIRRQSLQQEFSSVCETRRTSRMHEAWKCHDLHCSCTCHA